MKKSDNKHCCHFQKFPLEANPKDVSEEEKEVEVNDCKVHTERSSQLIVFN